MQKSGYRRREPKIKIWPRFWLEMPGIQPRGVAPRIQGRKQGSRCFIFDVSHLLYIIHVRLLSRHRDRQGIFGSAPLNNARYRTIRFGPFHYFYPYFLLKIFMIFQLLAPLNFSLEIKGVWK
jgi:hypothetical protein